MLVKELIQRIQSLYSKGTPSSDSRLSNRHIYSKIKTVRTRLMAQEIRKRRKLSEWNYQVLPCIELTKVEAHDCPCIPPVGCKILRSKYEIPEILMGYNTDQIQFVSNIDRTKKIDQISINAINSFKGNKYTSKHLGFFLHNKYLYIVASDLNLKFVMLKAIFEDPVEADKFKNYCNICENCPVCEDPLELEFHIDNELIEPLIEISLNELVVMFSSSIEDLTNNSRDSLKEQSK